MAHYPLSDPAPPVTGLAMTVCILLAMGLATAILFLVGLDFPNDLLAATQHTATDALTAHPPVQAVPRVGPPAAVGNSDAWRASQRLTTSRSSTALPASITSGLTIESISASPALGALLVALCAVFAAWALRQLHWALGSLSASPPEAMALLSVSGAPALPKRNILIFGPNGSGKGTQGALIVQQYPGMAHIESGAIFRQHIGGGTKLGQLAKTYIDRGDLVPDDITIPMVLETMKERGGNGWLLDGFPRNVVQAERLWAALQDEGMQLDYVVEILLPRMDAKGRIMGRRLCATDPNHPNNVGISAIAPNAGKCRVCGGDLSARADDQDEGAIDKRHDIYYDQDSGTLAAVAYYRRLADRGQVKFLQLDGTGSIAQVKEILLTGLQQL